ncbi:MAG: AraC family transcriptional regulator [Planctomycetia bacterium]|jgi:AraC family L-rhamnose operon regulatory protein RhaS
MKIPRYHNETTVYEADTCQPVVEAIKKGTLVQEALARGHYPGRRLTDGMLPGVKSVGFWDARKPQDWGLDPHRNEGVELTFLETGHLAFKVDGDNYQLSPDHLTITRPWQEHSLGDPHIGANRLHCLIIDVKVRRPNQTWEWPGWLILSPADIDQLTRILRHNEQPVWKANSSIRRCFHDIGESVVADRNGSSTSQLALRINELLILLLDMFRKEKLMLDSNLSSSQRTVELFLKTLARDTDLLAYDWSLKKLAKSCGLGVTQFTNHCKRLTNLSPNEYLNVKRLEKSKQLLLDTDLSVLQIALKCGFGSSQYFATVFRRQEGITPRDFRKEHVEA